MTVYVTVQSCQGLIHEARAHLTEQGAAKAERRWLRKRGIHTPDDREAQARNGNEIRIFEAKLAP